MVRVYPFEEQLNYEEQLAELYDVYSIKIFILNFLPMNEILKNI